MFNVTSEAILEAVEAQMDQKENILLQIFTFWPLEATFSTK